MIRLAAIPASAGRQKQATTADTEGHLSTVLLHIAMVAVMACTAPSSAETDCVWLP
jgi:hypothetical protein